MAALGAVDQVQRAALVEEQRRRRVEVLGALRRGRLARLLLAADDAAAEAGRVARRVADGEDDPAAEAVVDAAPSLRACETRPAASSSSLGEAALVDERAAERVPRVDRVAELVGRERLVGEAAAAHVVERRLAVAALGQDAVVEGDRRVERIAQALAPGVLAAGPLAELDAGARRPGGAAPRGSRSRRAP